jgi:hypothetical protein
LPDIIKNTFENLNNSIRVPSEILAKCHKLIIDTATFLIVYTIYCVIKVTFVTGREGGKACETSRTPLFLDNRLTDSSVCQSYAPAALYPLKKIPGIHFCSRLSQPTPEI